MSCRLELVLNNSTLVPCSDSAHGRKPLQITFDFIFIFYRGSCRGFHHLRNSNRWSHHSIPTYLHFCAISREFNFRQSNELLVRDFPSHNCSKSAHDQLHEKSNSKSFFDPFITVNHTFPCLNLHLLHLPNAFTRLPRVYAIINENVLPLMSRSELWQEIVMFSINKKLG